jgi:hypothetical protein
MSDAPRPAIDLYAELASHLDDEEQRQLLRALLDRLADGGGAAVREEVRTRLRAILEGS